MTTNTTTSTNGHMPSASKSKTASGSKQPKRSAASRRPVKRAGKRTAAPGGYSEAATRLLSRGAKAAGGAYEWAVEGAERAVPIAARHMPDQRTVQRLADERPYILGAIGLGIGAVIGLMLPTRLMGSTASPQSRPVKRASRKR